MRLTVTIALSGLLAVAMPFMAQSMQGQTTSEDVTQLRRELQDTREQLSDALHQLDEMRRSMAELSSKVDGLRSPDPQTTTGTAQAAPAIPGTATTEPTTAAADQDADFLASKIAELHQVKVETASRYPLRLSGLVLF